MIGTNLKTFTKTKQNKSKRGGQPDYQTLNSHFYTKETAEHSQKKGTLERMCKRGKAVTFQGTIKYH